MVDLDDRDVSVLRVFVEGPTNGCANPKLIREETGLNRGDVNTVLTRLGRGGYVRQVTRGLYEVTEQGIGEVSGDEWLGRD